MNQIEFRLIYISSHILSQEKQEKVLASPAPFSLRGVVGTSELYSTSLANKMEIWNIKWLGYKHTA